jgi:hypothetical protein
MKLVLLLLLVACSRGASDAGPTPSPTPVRNGDATTMASSNVVWRARTIAPHGLTIDFVDGAQISEGAGGDQHFAVQNHDAVLAAVRIGKTIDLAWWRASFGQRKLAFGAQTALVVCDRPATRQEVTVPAETATGLVPARDGGIGHIESQTPAEVHVAVAGTTATGTPFIATWVVAADRRDARRADENHFFASIRCM